ncbi:MAG: hypothetical protein J0H98_02455 [Solirubrobacterales bacterium]|nr:hypothetical protein [Solirubrobacterales bacterium]
MRKLIYLPTPRWTLAFVGAAVTIAAIVVAITGPGEDNLAPTFGLTVPTWIASVVIGVWVAGMEYGQKTMSRTLNRNPDRIRLFADKIAVGLIAVTVMTAVATIVGTLLFGLASTGHDLTVPASEVLRVGFAGLAINLAVVIISMSLALLTRSMAGGIAVAFGFFFVIDSLLTEIPKVGKYMFSPVANVVSSRISGPGYESGGEIALGLAVMLTVAWVAAFALAAGARFVRSDA